ncbi:MAG: hypothetical protein RLZZ262_1214 [Bacteroidota bacterium]|jgi:hypothetical protein
MKKTFWTLCCILALTAAVAQKKDQLGGYFLLQGQLLHVDPYNQQESAAGSTEVIVYQGEEIYVVFDSKSTGKYEFYLPIGHLYTITYGGKQFVNKKVIVDATTSPREKKPRTMRLDIGLFTPVEGFTFTSLQQPFVKIAYNKEYDDFVPDFDHTEQMMRLLDKDLKAAKKSRSKAGKPSKPAPSEENK